MRNARMERWYQHTLTVTSDNKKTTTVTLLPIPAHDSEGNLITPAVWVAVMGKKKH